jgi:hypothetical protein
MGKRLSQIETTAAEAITATLYGSIWNRLSDAAFEELSELHWKRFYASGLPTDHLGWESVPRCWLRQRKSR